MYCVYARHVKTGREQLIGAFETMSDAAIKIANCHRIDSVTCQFGEYYYFIKGRGVNSK